MNTRSRQSRHWGEAPLQRAVDAADIALWSWNVDTDDFDMDDRGLALWAITTDEMLTFEHLSAKIHPADRDRVRAAFSATRAVVGPYEIDFRTLVDDEVRWISARGRGSDEDIVKRTMVGVFLDVSGRKQAEESSEILAGEMSHRVKNLLSIATGLARITSRSASGVEDMANQLTHRLIALGRAHDLVRPLPGRHGDAALSPEHCEELLTERLPSDQPASPRAWNELDAKQREMFDTVIAHVQSRIRQVPRHSVPFSPDLLSEKLRPN